MAQGQPTHSVWATRFIFAAIVMGAITFGWFVYLLYLDTFCCPVSRALAAGSVAIWLLIGFVGLVAATVGTATTALFYQHIEVNMRRPYKGLLSYLAWGHLVLMIVGVVVAASIMMWVGYNGGIALVPTQFGGGGHDAGYVHESIAGWSPPYIAAFMIVGGAGVLLGGLGYVIAWFKKS